jgi:ABC-type polysaccharide/polyol phosphate export permease
LTILRYIREAVADVQSGFMHYEIWALLGWSEIRQRYRRSTIGPLWLTLSMAITIAIMGPLYGRLFGQNTAGYIAFLSVGMVLWSFVSGLITDTSAGFIAAEGYIKEFNLPLSLFMFRVIWRNLIILIHNVIVVAVVLLFSWKTSPWALVTLPLALIFLVFNALWVGLFLGVICTRFRDVQQIVTSILQILFFVTPIMWQPQMLGQKAWLLNFNPMYFFFESVRAPLLGGTAPYGVWLGLICTSIAVFLVSAYFFGRFRNRIAYWL